MSGDVVALLVVGFELLKLKAGGLKLEGSREVELEQNLVNFKLLR